jgi:predicted peptidase
MKSLSIGFSLLLISPTLSAAEKLPLEKLIFKDVNGKTIPYRLMKPENYDPKKQYPLVIFLHGAGERGTDNEKQLVHGVPQFASPENRSKYPCFLIAPQCPENEKWVDCDWSADTHTQPKNPSESARLTLTLIDQLMKDFPIDPKRVYLTGLSMGGYGTWDLLARKPDLFAAGVIICGGADEATSEKIKHIPVWVFHGAKDTAVKPFRSWNMVKALEKVGGKPKMTEYKDVGHDSWNPAYRDPEMFKWLFAQTK